MFFNITILTFTHTEDNEITTGSQVGCAKAAIMSSCIVMLTFRQSNSAQQFERTRIDRENT